MPAHLTIATAIDKNKIASDTTYLVLLEMDIIDPNDGSIAATLYAVNNNEPFVFQGVTYFSTYFEIDVSTDKETAPSATISVYDMTQTFQAQLQAYGASMDWPCRLKVVNANAPEQLVDQELDFSVLTAQASDQNYKITFTLGSENPLTLRFPPRQQFRNRCFWKYKGDQCRYAGDLPTCDYSLDGANGCRVHNNVLYFGGFPGLDHTNSVA